MLDETYETTPESDAPNRPTEAQQFTRQERQLLEKTKRLIEIAMKKQTQSVFEIGKLLINAKTEISHGAFLPWVDENLPFKQRTAQLYMRLAEVLSHHASHLGIFQMNTLDALASKAMTAEDRDTIITEIASGDLKTDDEVLGRIAELSPVRADKSAQVKAQRAQACAQAARLTCEVAGDRIIEIIELLRAAGLKEFATAIEELVTAPASGIDKAELASDTQEVPDDPVKEEETARKTYSFPAFLA